MTEEIGYKKPPKHTRFKKGFSGNPKGRPKDRSALKDIINRKLSFRMNIIENGKRVRKSCKEIIVTRVVNNAMNGDYKAIKLLIDLSGFKDKENVYFDSFDIIDKDVTPEQAQAAYDRAIKLG